MRLLMLGAVLVVGVLVAMEMPQIVRYVKMEMM
jgi:hypothetical protein